LFPQDPTGCLNTHHQPHPPAFHTPRGRTNRTGRCRRKLHQCLRQWAPHQHTRLVRAPYPLSREGAP